MGLRKYSTAFCIGGMLLFASCSKKIFPGDIPSYISEEKNGLTAWDTFGNLKVTCIHYPNKYLAYKESISSGENYRKAIANLANENYFELRLSDSIGENEFLRIDDDPVHYQQRLNYLLKGLVNDVLLISGKDTLTTTDIHVERTYGLLPYNTVLLSFQSHSSKNIEDKTLFIYDREAGGRPLAFKFKATDLSKFPDIKIKN